MAGWIVKCIPFLIILQISSIWAQKQFTIEDIFGTSKFDTKTLSQVQWAPNSQAFTCYEKDEESGHRLIKLVNVARGEPSILISSDDIPDLSEPQREKRFTLPNYRWAPDGKSILLPNTHDLALVTLPDKALRQLTDDQDEERDPTFSPDSRYIAYLKDWNLHILSIQTGVETSLTKQGTEDLLVGRFDWVYEEEFGIRTGFEWSPDSKSIAYFQLDTSHEINFPIVDFIPVHNTVEYLKYPKAGERNAIVRIGVVSLQTKKTVWMDTGDQPDQYIPRIHWLPDGRHVAIQRLNRTQNKLDLILADVRTGKSRVILTDEDKNGWVDHPEKLFFLKSQPLFIWPSERSNWNHLYLYDTDGKKIRSLTSGNWNVVEVLHVDEANSWIYFIGTKASPLERQLYRVSLDGKRFERLSQEAGTHSVRMSEDGQYYLDVFSNIETPTRTTLHRTDGTVVRLIKESDIPALDGYALSLPEFLTIPTQDGFECNAYLMKPVDFDPARQYPVIVYTYGCPGTQVVLNSWRNGKGSLYNQLWLQNGYLVFGLDNRGMDNMGNDFKNGVYRDLSKGLEDQIAGVRYLKSLPFVDASRIGIRGWSGGGWMTCLAMTKGTGYFRAGVAVASVTDLRNYDTIWMERYMGLPDDNPEGYAESNVLNYAGDLEGSLLLIHGAADDNVHFSNTMQLVQALQDSGKTFEMMVYPNKKHSIRGQQTRVHLYQKMTDFFLKNL